MNSILAGSIHRSFSSPLAWGADRAGRDRGDWGPDSGSFPFSGRMAASCSCLEQKRWDVDKKRCTRYSKQASVISHRLQGGVVQGETRNSPLHIFWEARETGCPCPCEMMRCDGTGMTEPRRRLGSANAGMPDRRGVATGMQTAARGLAPGGRVSWWSATTNGDFVGSHVRKPTQPRGCSRAVKDKRRSLC